MGIGLDIRLIRCRVITEYALVPGNIHVFPIGVDVTTGIGRRRGSVL